jgi:tRNA pseudouridine55 synthase
MNGVLVVDKPTGPTSHDVVARVRRALRVRRIGHTGTLDPLASGVLPLVVGRATRLAVFLSSSTKEYEALVRFGAMTATYDADRRFDREGAGGAPAEGRAPAGLTAEIVESALEEFRGTYLQTPPPFSAKKIDGVRSHERARRNEAVTPAPVSVTVRRLTLEGYDNGLARLTLTCSAGFYVRSLAHDLGLRLGCGAYLEGLRRTASGGFGLDAAVALERIEAEGLAAERHLIPMEGLLLGLPSVVLSERGVMRAGHGNTVGPEDVLASSAFQWGDLTEGGREPARVRLLNEDGGLLGIAERERDGLLHPVIVLV